MHIFCDDAEAPAASASTRVAAYFMTVRNGMRDDAWDLG